MPNTDPSKSHVSSLIVDLKAAAFEFVGTTFFLLIGLGGIQASAMAATTSSLNPSPIERILFISTCMGLSLLVAAWLFFRITGALFNPNVSLALVILGIIKPVRFALFCIAQLAGAITASALIIALSPGDLLVNPVLHPSISPLRGVFIEMFTTAALVLAVLMLAAEKHLTTPFAPVGIGLTLFACHLWAVFYTGAAMNTARAFGPSVILGFPDEHHWVYWVGPCLGSLLSSGFYAILKHYDYLQLCPDQDAIDPQKSAHINTNPFTVVISRRAARRAIKTELVTGQNGSEIDPNSSSEEDLIIPIISRSVTQATQMTSRTNRTSGATPQQVIVPMTATIAGSDVPVILPVVAHMEMDDLLNPATGQLINDDERVQEVNFV